MKYLKIITILIAGWGLIACSSGTTIAPTLKTVKVKLIEDQKIDIVKLF